MEHYITLFDVGFAPQGLALHRSLQRHAGAHTLWVLCMDDEVANLLEALALPDVRTVRLSEVETDPLLEVKQGRNRAEYCWTLTPFTHDIVFERDSSARRVTYIDADVWLGTDPAPVFDAFEASGAAVQITEHAYAPEHDQTATSGRYCVQFLTMDRERSTPVRRWWQDRCVEWCFARVEDGKFGDQKYLDDWPQRFGDLVHVADPKSWFQGPWNATRFPYSEAIGYHFHSLRLVGDGLVRPVGRSYSIPGPHWRHLYAPYLGDLADALRSIKRVTGREPLAQVPPTNRGGLRPRKFARRIVKWIRKHASVQTARGLVRLP